MSLHKSTARVLAIAGNCALGSFYFGYSLTYLNVSLTTVECVYGIGTCVSGTEQTSKEARFDGTASALLPVGACIGAYLSGILLDTFSRRNCLVVTDLISIVGLCLGEYKAIYALYVSRIIIGMATGLNSMLVAYFIDVQVSLYIKEFTPPNLRGLLGSLNSTTISTGALVGFMVGIGYPDDLMNSYWRIVFILPVFTSALRSIILLTVFTDDPPGSYIKWNDRPQAIRVLKSIYLDQHVDQQLQRVEQEEDAKKRNSQTYMDMFTPRYRKQLTVGCLLGVLQQFSGINAVTFYSTMIFSQVSTTRLTINLLNIFLGLINICFSFAAGFLTKNFGRKTLLLNGDIACCLSLILLAVSSGFSTKHPSVEIYKIVVSGFIYLYAVSFQLSIGPITWLYRAEILPEKGLSISIIVNWVCVTFITFTFPIFNQAVGIDYSFLFFSISCLLGAFFIQFMIVETRDRSARSIDHMYYMDGSVKSESFLVASNLVKSNNILHHPEITQSVNNMYHSRTIMLDSSVFV